MEGGARGDTGLAGRLDAVERVGPAASLVCDHVAAHPPLLPAVYLEAHGLLRCQAQRGHWQIVDGVPLESGLMARCFVTGEPVETLDVRNRADRLAVDPDACAQVLEPLRSGEEVVGVLAVESSAPLDAEQRAAISEAAGALSGWLTRRWSPRPVVAFERLARVGRRLAEVHDESHAEALVVRLAAEVSGFGSAALLRVAPTGELVPRAVHGPLGSAFAGVETAGLERLHAAVSQVSSLYTSDEVAGRTDATTRAVRRAGVASFAVAPVRSRRGSVALLAVVDARRIPISTNDIEALELFALLAATALDNASMVDELRNRASHDPLTGLGNHRAFHEAVADAHGTTGSWAVVMIDLDRFKAINDVYGHLEGDRVLRSVAEALPSALAPGERAFRIGGDEFAVLLVQNDLARARAVAERAAEVTRGALETYGAGLSAGVAAPGEGEHIDEVLARADRQLYDAKWAAVGRPRRRAADQAAELR